MLDTIGFVWNVDFYDSEKSTQQQHWDEMFDRVKDFKVRFGHLTIRHDYRTEDGCKLGQWVSIQRSNFRDQKIDDKRKALLEDIGFLWRASDGAGTPPNNAGPGTDALVDTSDDESVAATRPKKRLRRLRTRE